MTEKQASLSQVVSCLDPATKLLESEEFGTFTVEAVHKIICSIRNEFSDVKNKNVILSFNSNLFLALFIIAFDSYAKKITLISQTSHRDSDEILLAAKANYLFTDECGSFSESVSPTIIDKSILEFSQNKELDKQEPIDTHYELVTSGTSGKPKLLSHSKASLTRHISKNVQGFKPIWGLLYDLSRFAGFQVFLQSLTTGNLLLIPREGSSLDEIIIFFQKKACNCLSATPTMWRKILMSKNSARLDLKQITLGGEIADQNILNGLNCGFPDAKIFHIYAMTEVGVVFTVKDKLAGFPQEYISKSPGKKIKIDPEGGLWIYPDLHKPKLIFGGKFLVDEEGYIFSGDKVLKEESRYYFLGRESGIINVGGNKVFPENVENILLSFPGVKMVKVYGKKSSITGELVCAKIVRISDQREDKKFLEELRDYSKKYLEPYEVPAIIDFVKQIETNEAGKIKR